MLFTIFVYTIQSFLMRMLIIVTALFLNACTSTQGVSVYLLTNSQLEYVLKQQLSKLREEIYLRGLPVEFSVNSVNVNIGPNSRLRDYTRR
jgi:uncharacterized lipoprotein YmbA